jgi:hypothetical protein
MKRSALIFVLICSLAGSIVAQSADPRLVVILVGTAVGVPTMVPDYTGDGTSDPAICWDLDMVDAKTDRVIGSAKDCFSPQNPEATKGVGTTYFYFPQGMLVSRGKNTGQPVMWDPSTNLDVDPNVTVITGAFPAPGTNNILSGTRRFAGARGRVRLSGAVRPHPPDGLTTTFSCIFIIDLYRPSE